MEGLELLINRHSISRLIAPKPEGKQLNNILLSGMRVPDHGLLRPKHFFIITGKGRNRFSDLLKKGAMFQGKNEKEIEKICNEPFLAPMIIAVIAKCYKEHRIPIWEQEMSAGCSVMAMQLAAIAQGFNGIWRTGELIDNPVIREGFSCREQDKIVGYLYLGTPQIKVKYANNTVDIKSFVTDF